MRYFAVYLLALSSTASAQNFDFTNTNFSNGEQVTLRGKWAFYWDTLFVPNQQTPVSSMVKVPHYWDDNDPGLFGKATYYAHLKLPANATQLSVHIPFVRCAGRIYVDGLLVGTLGVVDPKEDYHSKLASLLINLPTMSEVDLVIQVANYENQWAGLSSIPRVGQTSALLHRIQVKQGFDIFFVGSLIAMAIYLITMYYLYRQGFSFLYLALICVAVVLRSLTTESSSLFLPNLFPDIGWGAWKRIEFLAVYIIVALLPLYVSRVFPGESNKIIDWTFIAIASLLCLTVIFTQHYVYVSVLDVAHVGLLLGFVYSCVITARALKKKNPDARILFIGLLVAFPFILMEILKNSALLQVPIPFSHLVEFGVLIFLLFQVYVLAHHYAQSYQDLETQVKKRTLQLTQSNELNNRMLAILSHDVRGPVNALKSVMSMFNQGQLGESELKPLAIQIESQAGSISLLIENVLLWVKTQINGIELTWETFALAEWVDPHLDLYAIQAKSRQLKLESLIQPSIKVKADKQVISLVVRNLVANAVKYAEEHSTITLTATVTENTIRLTVTNKGPGMSPGKIEAIFQPLKTLESRDSTGLGLKLCRSYLLAMETDFEIVSIPNQQTSFSIQLSRTN
jgi:signal transduction histidine kinase